MRKWKGSILLSASDLNGFLGCKHSTFLDLNDLNERLPRAKDDFQAKLVQDKGIEHEGEFLESLKKSEGDVVEVSEEGGILRRVAATDKIMRDGPGTIYQAAFLHGIWHGYADFLQRVDSGPSQLGPYSYEAVDTKLSQHPSPKHVIQLCVYSELLQQVQGMRPHGMSLVLGDNSQLDFRFDDFAFYYATIKRRFEEYVAVPPALSRPEPCHHCSMCKWRDLCSEQLDAEDHLSRVANIRRAQILKLEEAGVTTLAALANLDDTISVPGFPQGILEQLKAQASLQLFKRKTGKNRVETLDECEYRGFFRIPQSDQGDLFFDME